jgi:hypothetical protein|tara:strand:+ start:82 stop:261 length:180 start_codon:yes stop_codon:yes gene_type:complete
MKNLFQGCVDHYELQQLRLDQLVFIHKITIDKSKTEVERVKEIKKLFPNVINGSGDLIK